jgi:hypothetical protein
MAFRALASGLGIGRNAWLCPLDVTFKTKSTGGREDLLEDEALEG